MHNIHKMKLTREHNMFHGVIPGIYFARPPLMRYLICVVLSYFLVSLHQLDEYEEKNISMNIIFSSCTRVFYDSAQYLFSVLGKCL